MEVKILLGIGCSILVLVGIGFVYAYLAKTPIKKMSNGDFWAELAAKLKQKKIAVMVQEKRSSPVWQETAKIIDSVVAPAFIKAVKERATQGVSRLSAADLNIIHAAVNNQDGKLPSTVDVLVVITTNTDPKTPEKAVLTFKYCKFSGGKMQEISCAEQTEIRLDGVARDALQKINFPQKLIEGFAGFKDAAMGRRVKTTRR